MGKKKENLVPLFTFGEYIYFTICWIFYTVSLLVLFSFLYNFRLRSSNYLVSVFLWFAGAWGLILGIKRIYICVKSWGISIQIMWQWRMQLWDSFTYSSWCSFSSVGACTCRLQSNFATISQRIVFMVNVLYNYRVLFLFYFG